MRRLPLAHPRRFRRTAFKDAEVGVPTKDWKRGLTPTEKSVRPLVDLGKAETDETYARRLGRRLPSVHGREQQVDGLVERIEVIERRREAIDDEVDRIEGEHGEHFGFMPLVGFVLEALMVLALAVAAIPMDVGAFQIVPLDQRMLNAAVAAVGLFIAFGTVAVGRGARFVVDTPLPPKKLVAYAVAVIGGLLALELGAVPGLAFLREQFVRRTAVDANAGQLDFAGIGSAFTRLQIAMVFVGVVVSFFAHNPAATRRRHLRFVSGWLGLRTWFLTKRLHFAERVLAIVGARLSTLRLRFEARVAWIVAYCAYMPEYYRTHLLHRHPAAQDPEVGDRPPVIVPAQSLADDPERWSATYRRLGPDWLSNLRERRQRAHVGSPSSNGHREKRSGE